MRRDGSAALAYCHGVEQPSLNPGLPLRVFTQTASRQSRVGVGWMRTTQDERRRRGLQESASSALFTAVRAAEGREFRIDFGGHGCVPLALNSDSNDCRASAMQAIRESLRVSDANLRRHHLSPAARPIRSSSRGNDRTQGALIGRIRARPIAMQGLVDPRGDAGKSQSLALVRRRLCYESKLQRCEQ